MKFSGVGGDKDRIDILRELEIKENLEKEKAKKNNTRKKHSAKEMKKIAQSGTLAYRKIDNEFESYIRNEESQDLNKE